MKEEVKLHIYKPDLSTELELPYADGGYKGWQLKREYISKQYTTNLDDVIVLRVIKKRFSMFVDE